MLSTPNVSWPGWEIVRRIGSGSFGTVYEIQRDVYGDIEKAALKVITIPHNEDEVDYLRCSGLDDASITRTFHQQVGDIAKEYKLMAQLRENPNIVRCDDFRDIQHDDSLGWDIYIKMELLTPLMKCLNVVETEEQIVRLGMELCNALVTCQEKNIIHRDIKPQNVFVSESGRFKLGDFGIARTIERATHATAGIGTYSYMAPEVERNEVYGKTVDIYSLGLLLYWLLNERRGPFMPLPPKVPKYGDEEQARRRRFAGEALPAPKNGSKQLKAIVLRACSFKPEDRFESAQAFYDALSSLLVKQPEVPPAEVAPAPVVQVCEDDATVGVGWELKKQEMPVPVQPVEEGEDATVGPVFAREKRVAEKPKASIVPPVSNSGSANSAEKETGNEDERIGIALPNGFWRCVCGRTNAAYVSSCACGVNKRELKLVKQEQANEDVIPQGFWKCSCGIVNASYVFSCACGASKGMASTLNGSKAESSSSAHPRSSNATHSTDRLLQSNGFRPSSSNTASEDESWKKSEAAYRAWRQSLEKK